MPQSITPKDVVISVTGTQKYEGQETQTVELVTDGTLTEVDGKFLVSYAESDMTGLEGTTTTFEVDKHRITLTRTGETASVTVRDQGRGISPEDLENVRVKFYKGKNAVRGSGIGLAVVDEIVTALGGTLDIASTLGQGTAVTVTLPVYHPGQEHLHEQI